MHHQTEVIRVRESSNTCIGIFKSSSCFFPLGPAWRAHWWNSSLPRLALEHSFCSPFRPPAYRPGALDCTINGFDILYGIIVLFSYFLALSFCLHTLHLRLAISIVKRLKFACFCILRGLASHLLRLVSCGTGSRASSNCCRRFSRTWCTSILRHLLVTLHAHPLHSTWTC